MSTAARAHTKPRTGIDLQDGLLQHHFVVAHLDVRAPPLWIGLLILYLLNHRGAKLKHLNARGQAHGVVSILQHEAIDAHCGPAGDADPLGIARVSAKANTTLPI